MDTNYNLYFCNYSAGNIIQINTLTNTFTALISLAAFTICIDTNNMLYIASYSTNKLYKYNTNGVSQGTAMDISKIVSVAVDSALNIYVGATSSVYITKYTSFGGTATNYIGGGTTTFGNIVDGTTTITDVRLDGINYAFGLYIIGNNLYISLNTGFIAYADMLTGKMYKYATGFSQPYGMVIDNNGVGYACDWGGARIYKITTPGTKVVFAGGGTLNTGLNVNLTSSSIKPLGIVIAPNNRMYVTDQLNNSIRQIYQ
jgi:hypothetical protein